MLAPAFLAWHIWPMQSSAIMAGIMGLLLAGCAQFPELEDTVPPNVENAEFPELVPLPEVLNQQTDQRASAEEAREDVAGRAAALQAKAARLRGRVVDNATRSRMQQGVPPL